MDTREFDDVESYVVVSEQDVSSQYAFSNGYKQRSKVHSEILKEASLEHALEKKKQLSSILGKCRIARLEFID